MFFVPTGGELLLVGDGGHLLQRLVLLGRADGLELFFGADALGNEIVALAGLGEGAADATALLVLLLVGLLGGRLGRLAVFLLLARLFDGGALLRLLLGLPRALLLQLGLFPLLRDG